MSYFLIWGALKGKREGDFGCIQFQPTLKISREGGFPALLDGLVRVSVHLSVKQRNGIPFSSWFNCTASLCKKVAQWLIPAYHDNLNMRCETLSLPGCMSAWLLVQSYELHPHKSSCFFKLQTPPYSHKIRPLT